MAALDAISLDEAKEALVIQGTTLDPALQRLITGLTLQLEARLGTQFVQRSVVEYHPGGSRKLYLGRTPIVSVASIADPAGNVVPATEYAIRQKRWLEHIGHFPTAYDANSIRADWTVTYTAGWFTSSSTVTSDVKEQLTRALATTFSNPDPSVASVKVGDLDVGYDRSTSEGEAVGAKVIEAAAADLFNYRGVWL